MYAIETNSLTKRYGKRCAVENLNMRVPEGSVYGFVGKNGAGKSTTMKMIAGLCHPSSGELSLFGADVSRSRHHAVPVGALIENPGLAPKLSAAANLMVKARVMGVSHARQHCDELLSLVGLGNVANKRTKDFSQGMKQRLGIALALVGNPRLLLLDEPLNGLDPEGQREMRTMIGSLAQQRGVTVIISSHVLDQLNRVADRFGVISQGRLVAEFDDAEMQAACGRAIRVRTVDQPRALEVLKTRLCGANIALTADGAIEITGEGTPDVLPVSQVLHEADIVLLELGIVSRDIEDFFVELMEREGGRA